MDSSNTLIFKLEQHTPLMHFQADQIGAVLRATEVKTKLDRFLWKNWIREKGKSAVAFEEYRKYLTGYDDKKPNNLLSRFSEGYRSLDYKIRVTDLDKTPIEERITEIKLITEIEKGVYSENISIVIKTYHDFLTKEIKQNLKAFFCQTNFGKRQSKGLGSFTIEGTSEKEFIDSLRQLKRDVYSLTDRNIDVKNFYAEITRRWRILKSGSQIGKYIKSKLFKYMSAKGHRWEKRLIKVTIDDDPDNYNYPYPLLNTNQYAPLDSSVQEEKVKDDESYFGWDDNKEVNFDYFFVRALLGLPELYEFRTTERATTYQILIKGKEKNNKVKVERFKSPVTFKVFEKSIYAVVEDIPEDLLGSFFDFLIVIKSSDRKSEPKLLIGDLPVPGKFNINDFLEKYFKSVGFEKI